MPSDQSETTDETPVTAAFLRALRERGFTVVPIEPTEAMLRAAERAMPDDDGIGFDTFMRTEWAAMLKECDSDR